jgi:omega-6 fatty acid desaturase (delta-12 desaturase)
VSREVPPLSAARAYAQPVLGRSVRQIAANLLALAVLLALMWVNSGERYAVTLLLALPAGGFLLRLFMIEHDCGHGSFFASRPMNDAVGRVIGILTLMPYGYWKRSHAVHHATSGNLSRRGIGNIDTLTVAEYRHRTRLGRLRYRLYRHPLLLLGLGPIWQIFLRQRLPFHLPKPRRASVLSILGNDLVLAAVLAGAWATVGLERLLLVWFPPLLVTAVVGIWLFYVQHQFEPGYWAPAEEWRFEDAALRGSSFYDLPALLRFFTASIGYHHVHHLYSRIPNYRLREFVGQHSELSETNRLTLRDSARCLRLALWDEERGCLIGFDELKRAHS